MMFSIGCRIQDRRVAWDFLEFTYVSDLNLVFQTIISMINYDDGDEPRSIQEIHAEILFDVIEIHWIEIQQDSLTDHRWFSSR